VPTSANAGLNTIVGKDSPYHKQSPLIGNPVRRGQQVPGPLGRIAAYNSKWPRLGGHFRCVVGSIRLLERVVTGAESSGLGRASSAYGILLLARVCMRFVDKAAEQPPMAVMLNAVKDLRSSMAIPRIRPPSALSQLGIESSAVGGDASGCLGGYKGRPTTAGFCSRLRAASLRSRGCHSALALQCLRCCEWWRTPAGYLSIPYPR